ncbi:MAG: peptidoglycan-binding protein [Alphaproteobacteria bacterium]
MKSFLPGSTAALALMVAALGATPAARADAPTGVLVLAALQDGADGPSLATVDGARGALVRRVQRRLRELGLYRGMLDARLTPETKAAIRNYQRQAGLPVDGTPSPALLEHLESAASDARRLLNRIETLRAEQIETARRALDAHESARRLVAVAAGARPPRPSEDETAACFAAPTPACLLDEARAAAASVDRVELRDWAFGELAAAFAGAGDGAAARATAGRMADPRLVISTLGKIAVAQAGAGDYRGARTTARAIPDTRLRARALNAVAAAQAVAGDAGATRLSLAEALAATGTVADPGRRALLLSEIAGIEAKLGDRTGAAAHLDEAAAGARRAATADERGRLLGRIAASQADAGLPAEALATTDRIAEPRHRAPALIRVAVAQAERGAIARAFATAATIDDPHARALALLELALIQDKAGDPAAARATLGKARAVAEAIAFAYTRAYALGRIARAQAETGAPGDAFETARAIDHPTVRARAFWMLAVAQAASGDWAAARRSEALADAASAEIRDPLERVWLLGDVAVARLAGGDATGAEAVLERALDYAGSLASAWLRARALARLATTLVDLRRSRPDLASGRP